MPKAFISYASKDSDFAEVLRSRLEEAGIRVWIDHVGIQAGGEWQKTIDEEISSSDVLIIVITQNLVNP